MDHRRTLLPALLAVAVVLGVVLPSPGLADTPPDCRLDGAESTCPPPASEAQPLAPPASETPPPEPSYQWVWNGTAWEAEDYPYVWDGSRWVERPAAPAADTGAEAASEAVLSADLLTGANTVSSNTAAGDLVSGDIRAAVTAITSLNSALSVGGGTYSQLVIPGDVQGDLDLTRSVPVLQGGSDSNQASVASILSLVDRHSQPAESGGWSGLTVRTTGLGRQELLLVADTGNNTVSSNTEVGTLITGDIAVIVNLLTMINAALSTPLFDLTVINMFGDLAGNILLPDGAGTVIPLSSARQAAAGTSPHAAAWQGEATVDRLLTVRANTGENTVTGNTAAGPTTTGSVGVYLAVHDRINQMIGGSLFLYLVNVLGPWMGAVVGTDGLPGAVIVSHPSEVGVPSSTSGEEEGVRHTAAVASLLHLEADTGRNRVTDNTGAGGLTTGNITVLGNVVSLINQAVTLGERLTIGLINILGHWTGNIGPRSAFRPEAEIQRQAVGSPQDQEVQTTEHSPEAGTQTVSISAAAAALSVASRESAASSPANHVAKVALAPEGHARAAEQSNPWSTVAVGLLALGASLVLLDRAGSHGVESER